MRVGGPNGTRTRAAALKERKGRFCGVLIGIRTHSPRFVKLNAGAGFLGVRAGRINKRGSDGFAAIHIGRWDERLDVGARLREFSDTEDARGDGVEQRAPIASLRPTLIEATKISHELSSLEGTDVLGRQRKPLSILAPGPEAAVPVRLDSDRVI